MNIVEMIAFSKRIKSLMTAFCFIFIADLAVLAIPTLSARVHMPKTCGNAPMPLCATAVLYYIQYVRLFTHPVFFTALTRQNNEL